MIKKGQCIGDWDDNETKVSLSQLDYLNGKLFDLRMRSGKRRGVLIYLPIDENISHCDMKHQFGEKHRSGALFRVICRSVDYPTHKKSLERFLFRFRYHDTCVAWKGSQHISWKHVHHKYTENTQKFNYACAYSEDKLRS